MFSRVTPSWTSKEVLRMAGAEWVLGLKFGTFDQDLDVSIIQEILDRVLLMEHAVMATVLEAGDRTYFLVVKCQVQEGEEEPCVCVDYTRYMVLFLADVVEEVIVGKRVGGYIDGATAMVPAE